MDWASTRRRWRPGAASGASWWAQEIVGYPRVASGRAPEDADQGDVLRRTLRPFVMRWPAGFRVDEDIAKQAERAVEPLYETSANGYRRKDIIGLMETVDSPFGKVREVVPLALLVEGPLGSQWNDKPLPKKEDPASEAPADDMPPFDFDSPPGGSRRWRC